MIEPSAAERFDIASGEWQPISPLPDGGVAGGEAFVYEGRIFIVGGRASKEAPGQAKPLQYGPHQPCCDDAPEPEPEKPVQGRDGQSKGLVPRLREIATAAGARDHAT